jgi:hypothetical protein
MKKPKKSKVQRFMAATVTFVPRPFTPHRGLAWIVSVVEDLDHDVGINDITVCIMRMLATATRLHARGELDENVFRRLQRKHFHRDREECDEVLKEVAELTEVASNELVSRAPHHVARLQRIRDISWRLRARSAA